MLGLYFMNGTALPRDPEKAFTLFKAAAERGESNAAHNVGRCYFDGDGVEKNYVEAKNWFSKAYDLGDKSDKVVNLYWRANSFINAEKGDAEAQWRVGNFYKYGEYVEKDLVEAVKWYRKSAEQGDATGQNYLGDCYWFGDGVERDYAEAAKWYRKSAEQGDATGQKNLGDCYRGGNGVEQDYAEAVKWYRKAADQGEKYAQYYLGECYLEGRGVAQDKTEAVKWLRKAAEQGNEGAKEKLKTLE